MCRVVLSAERLTKRYNDQDAVHDISFDIEQGQIVAFYGQAGSGKTTLLNLVSGALQPTAGKVFLMGEHVNSPCRQPDPRIGFMFLEHGVYSRMTTRQYLNFFRRIYNLPPDRIAEAIALTGLIDRQHDKLKGFSPSLLARVHMARAILHKPKLLLLDEPTVNLDTETTEILRKLLLSLAEEGMSVMLATSSREEAASLAAKTAYMRMGRLESWEMQEAAPDAGSTAVPEVGARFSLGKIPARINDRIILFNPTELTYIESLDGASVLHTSGEQFQCPLTLTELEERLKPFGFFRPHRSYIVNLQRVREVIPWTRNSFSLILDDAQKTSIPLSKNSIKELEGILGV